MLGPPWSGCNLSMYMATHSPRLPWARCLGELFELALEKPDLHNSLNIVRGWSRLDSPFGESHACALLHKTMKTNMKKQAGRTQVEGESNLCPYLCPSGSPKRLSERSPHGPTGMLAPPGSPWGPSLEGAWGVVGPLGPPLHVALGQTTSYDARSNR